MNPFELPGPEFLAFYAAFGLIVLGVLMLLRHGWEPETAPRMGLTNPYAIACLRGGRHEALRVATLALVDRDVLRAGVNRLETRDIADVERVKDPLEKAVLARFARGGDEAISLFKDDDALSAADALGASLERLGLVADKGTRQNRRGRLVLAWAALWIVAGLKIAIGLSRHRPVQLLVMLALALSFWALRLHDPRRTRRGEALLDDLQTLFARLKERADQLRPRKDMAEAALLAAVFGLATLPMQGWGYLRTLYPKGTQSATSSCGASCGSSCGGGGCGGGCGGCGS